MEHLLIFVVALAADADNLMVANSDDLFDREEFSAAPDARRPNCFNSGVFVFRQNLGSNLNPS